MAPVVLLRVRPTGRQKHAMTTMLRSLLGEINFNRLCLGIEVGALDDDVLQILVPAEKCAADITRHHSDEFAVAAEYALGRPIRMVNVVSAHSRRPVTCTSSRARIAPLAGAGSGCTRAAPT
jgi:hypothetical protein